MAAFPQELGEFQRQLTDLKTRSQQKIKNLTQLADELHANYCYAVVQILNEEIKNAKLSRVQALFSLVDSILKKVSKEYKVQIGRIIGGSFGICLARADEANQEWLGKMVSLSWKKHGLLAEEVIADLEQRLANPQTHQPEPASSSAPLSFSQQTPPSSVPPHQQPVAQPQYPSHAQHQQYHAPQTSYPSSHQGYPQQTPSPWSAPSPMESVDVTRQRRLQILTKIVETHNITPEEMAEITQVPEIRAAIGLQQQGKKREAMELLMQFKTQLANDQQQPSLPPQQTPAKGSAQPPAKRLRPDEPAAGYPKKQGGSVRFGPEWVRNFLQQTGPSRAPFTAVSIGRRIVSQVSDQVAFADELQPKEILLLLRFIYMLETHLKKTVAIDSDLSQRIPYTFTQLPLMLDPPSYGLIKAYFEEYPYQCSTCGKRFCNQSSLSEHHDRHFRRNTAVEKGLSQGWMESVSVWVGKEVQLSDVGRRREEAQRQHRKLMQQQQKNFVPVVPVEEFQKDREENPLQFQLENSIIVESVPYNEVQPLCLLCGEEFDIEWNTQFCDWGCQRAVALDPITYEIIDFRSLAVADGGSARRIGDAVIYHKACADDAKMAQ